MISLQMVEQEPDLREFQSEPKITGVLLSGSFSSVFQNRPIPDGISEKKIIPNQK